MRERPAPALRVRRNHPRPFGLRAWSPRSNGAAMDTSLPARIVVRKCNEANRQRQNYQNLRTSNDRLMARPAVNWSREPIKEGMGLEPTLPVSRCRPP